jgi:hypothetical protein
MRVMGRRPLQVRQEPRCLCQRACGQWKQNAAACGWTRFDMVAVCLSPSAHLYDKPEQEVNLLHRDICRWRCAAPFHAAHKNEPRTFVSSVRTVTWGSAGSVRGCPALRTGRIVVQQLAGRVVVLHNCAIEARAREISPLYLRVQR